MKSKIGTNICRPSIKQGTDHTWLLVSSRSQPNLSFKTQMVDKKLLLILRLKRDNFNKKLLYSPKRDLPQKTPLLFLSKHCLNEFLIVMIFHTKSTQNMQISMLAFKIYGCFCLEFWKHVQTELRRRENNKNVMEKK